MTRRTPARADLETPYRRDYLASMDRLMKEGVMPETLGKLLRWYEAVWSNETPARLHSRGVWRSSGEIVRGIPTETGYHGEPMKRERIPGGSILGTPQDGDAFRRYIEGDPKARDADGYYATPLRAAFLDMAYGQGRASGKPLLARFLFLIARCGFDVRKASDVRAMPLEEAEVLAEGALRILWKKYAERPDRRTEAA